MKYALIGCGRVAPNHIVAAMKNELDIVALCDVSTQAYQTLVTQYPQLASLPFYTDYKAMLEAEKPSLVAIATDSGSHADIAVDCINSGCNCIIEKPIALSLADADRIIEAAEKNNVKVAANHQNRFNLSIRKIRSAVDGGRFGRMLHGTTQTRWFRDESYYSQASWRGTWAKDGGALMNQCIHNIDLLNWMLGSEPVSVTAVTDNLMHPYIECEDFGLAIIKYANGAYATVEGTVNTYGGNMEQSLALFGENGAVKAEGSINNKITYWCFADGEDNSEQVKKDFSFEARHIYGAGHTPLYEDMVNAIQTDRKPYVDAYDGRKALELVLAIYKSSYLGKAVKLPLEEASTLSFSSNFKKTDTEENDNG